MDTLTNEGLRDIVRGYILKLYKFSETNLDITPINPITTKDYRTIRRSVRNNLTRAGGYFKVSDEELKKYILELGGEFTNH